jgi:hypothetical protein
MGTRPKQETYAGPLPLKPVTASVRKDETSVKAEGQAQHRRIGIFALLQSEVLRKGFKKRTIFKPPLAWR